MTKVKNIWLALGIIITLGSMLGMLCFITFDKLPTPIKQVDWSPNAQWITVPQESYRLYARKDLYLQGQVESAWLRLSGDNSFILYINGQQVARQSTNANSSEPFTGNSSLPFQEINDALSYKVVGEHRHIDFPRNWKLTYYVNLIPYLNPGQNVLAVEVQDPRKLPSLVVEGYIYPSEPSASQISLATGSTDWKVSNMDQSHENSLWSDVGFPDENWENAKVIGPVSDPTFSRLSKNLFARLLKSNWISGLENAQQQEWLFGNWQKSTEVGRAYVRFAGKGSYALLINGKLVRSTLSASAQTVSANAAANPVSMGSSNYNSWDNLLMYEVTDFLHPGNNSIVVHLAKLFDSNIDSVPLSFSLDGWVETQKGLIIDQVATDKDWLSLDGPPSNWSKKISDGKPVSLNGPVDVQSLTPEFAGNAYLTNFPDFLIRAIFWQITSVACTLFLTWLLGYFWLDRQDNFPVALTAGAAFILPGTLFLVGINLMKYRYAESERSLLFEQPQSNLVIFIAFCIVVISTLLSSVIKQQKMESTIQKTLNLSLSRLGLWSLWGMLAFYILGLAGGLRFSGLILGCLLLGLIALTSEFWSILYTQFQKRLIFLTPFWQAKKQVILVVLVILIGFILRIIDLGWRPIDSDESTSLDAISGILRTGAPMATSGIWYTRGPLFHYLEGAWLSIVGFSKVNARFLVAIIGTIALVVTFFFAKKLTGKFWLALLITGILAIDPWELVISRNVRFYQTVQLTTLLSFYFFYRGFIYQEGRKYQYLFFVCLTLSLLTQEGSMTQIPCYLIGFLCFYKPFVLKKDWKLATSFVLALVIYSFDGIFFMIKCLTEPVGQSGGTGAPIAFHLLNVAGFTQGFLVGNSRINTLYSLMFFAGFIYFLKRRDKYIVFLFASVLIFVLDLTLLVIQISPRYTVQYYPFLIILSVYSAYRILQSLANRFEMAINYHLPLKQIGLIFFALFVFFNIEPNRVIAAYKDTLYRNDDVVFQYIKEHRQPGDVVMANLPAAASVQLHGLDYYLPTKVELSLDEDYWNNGRLIERNAGGILVDNMDRLMNVFQKEHRIWIQLDENSPPANPAQLQLYNYLRTVSKPVYETLGVQLRLWESNDGKFIGVPNKGHDFGAY